MNDRLLWMSHHCPTGLVDQTQLKALTGSVMNDKVIETDPSAQLFLR